MNKQLSPSTISKKITDLETFANVSDLLIRDLRKRIILLETLISSELNSHHSYGADIDLESLENPY